MHRLDANTFAPAINVTGATTNNHLDDGQRSHDRGTELREQSAQKQASEIRPFWM